MDTGVAIFIQLLSIILTGLIGYAVGSAKSFREAKQKAYVELLPPILKVGYRQSDIKDPQVEDEFNKALSLLWLYASKKVARKMDYAVSIIIKPERGNFTLAIQQVITEMRKDLQISCFQRLRAIELKHFYTKIYDVKNARTKN